MNTFGCCPQFTARPATRFHKSNRAGACALALMLAVVTISSVHASSIVYQFSGLVVGVVDDLGMFPGVSGGTPVTGQFTYDTSPTAYDDSIVTATSSLFYDNPPVYNLITWVVSAGGTAVEDDNLTDTTSQRQTAISVSNPGFPAPDSFQIFSIRQEGDLQQTFNITYTDPSGAAFMTVDPPTMLDLMTPGTSAIGSYALLNTNTLQQVQLNYLINVFAGEIVPEPSSAALAIAAFGLLAGAGFMRRKR